jgi:hypothetical protein
MNIAYYDAMVACWDAKYTYWAQRPFHQDPTFTPLFNTPSTLATHPRTAACRALPVMSWGTCSQAKTEGYQTLVDVIGESRIASGLHFRSDVTVGRELAKAVAGKVIEYAQKDGAE